MVHFWRGNKLMSGSMLVMPSASAGSLFTVTASPPALNSGGNTATFTTEVTTAIAAGGSGSYSYLWTTEVTSTGTHGCAANSSTSATTTFYLSGILNGEELTAVAECLVTDTVTAETATVQVLISHLRDGGFL